MGNGGVSKVKLEASRGGGKGVCKFLLFLTIGGIKIRRKN
jgi:hypothetical protein